MSDRPDTFALVAFFLACAAVMAVGVLVLIHPTRNACDPKSLDRLWYRVQGASQSSGNDTTGARLFITGICPEYKPPAAP